MKSRLIGSVVTALSLIITACSTDATARDVLPTIPTPTVPKGGSVQVEVFYMIGFENPSSPGVWNYAPKLTLVGPAAGASDAITRISFEIPGVGRIPSCNTLLVLNSGQRMDLFPELYGEFSFTIVPAAGTRATSDNASVVLTLKDSRGAETTVAVSGKIVAGGLPTTDTNASPGVTCL